MPNSTKLFLDAKSTGEKERGRPQADEFGSDSAFSSGRSYRSRDGSITDFFPENQNRVTFEKSIPRIGGKNSCKESNPISEVEECMPRIVFWNSHGFSNLSDI